MPLPFLALRLGDLALALRAGDLVAGDLRAAGGDLRAGDGERERLRRVETIEEQREERRGRR